MAAGRVAEAVAELEALVAAEPLREEVVGVLMQALVAARATRGVRLPARPARRRARARPVGHLRELRRRVSTPGVPVGPAPGTRTGARPGAGAAESFVGRARVARVVEAVQRCRVVCSGPAEWARRGWPGTSPRRSPTRFGHAPCFSFGEGGTADVVLSPPRRCGSPTAAPSGAVRGRRHRRGASCPPPVGGAGQLRARLRRGRRAGGGDHGRRPARRPVAHEPRTGAGEGGAVARDGGRPAAPVPRVVARCAASTSEAVVPPVGDQLAVGTGRGSPVARPRIRSGPSNRAAAPGPNGGWSPTGSSLPAVDPHRFAAGEQQVDAAGVGRIASTSTATSPETCSQLLQHHQLVADR